QGRASERRERATGAERGGAARSERGCGGVRGAKPQGRASERRERATGAERGGGAASERGGWVGGVRSAAGPLDKSTKSVGKAPPPIDFPLLDARSDDGSGPPDEDV